MILINRRRTNVTEFRFPTTLNDDVKFVKIGDVLEFLRIERANRGLSEAAVDYVIVQNPRRNQIEMTCRWCSQYIRLVKRRNCFCLLRMTNKHTHVQSEEVKLE
jgi:hypothetical protein